MNVGYAAPEADAPSPVSRLAIWRAADDQAAWARPILLVITAISVFSYAWRASASVNIEIYYAAAVRSMSMSWHDFFFGALDPAGTVTTDKLPGAFWVQVLSVRVFGVHTWALVLPQVIEGALTILVLYHAVRRTAGPAAGLLAAAILAISPATVLLNRGNVPDTLMILLVVLAADAVVTCLVLWGIWLITTAAVFSASSAVNSYYTAALSPAVAALTGTGIALAWQHRERAWSWLAAGVALLAAAGYAVWLLPSSGTGLPSWLRPALIGLALAAACSLAVPFIWASGREVLPIGGFTGTIPEPSLPALKNLIGLGDVHTFLQSPSTTDPRLLWVAGNCLKVTKRSDPAPLSIAVYYCAPFVFLKSLG